MRKIKIWHIILTLIICPLIVGVILKYLPDANNENDQAPRLYSKVASANFASNGSLILRVLLSNSSKEAIQLAGTRVYLINLQEFKEQQKITIMKESPIDYKAILLPQSSETTYNFSITKDAFEKMQSGELAILSKTNYSTQSESQKKLYIVFIYGKINNDLATYKVWYE